MTFDQILPVVGEVLARHAKALESLDWLLVNRDLSGRVRLVAPESVKDSGDARNELERLASDLADELVPHAYPADAMILYEADRDLACRGASAFPLEGFDNVSVADRLTTESDWSRIARESEGAPRVVFYSIKGGVGRSTAVAATAWWLAQAGKRVLVLDLDLASPGLSSSLLPDERQPAYGVTDWLVEDLVGNADEMPNSMLASSPLSRDGEIYVVPAHGTEPGEHIAKLGRVWMPGFRPDGQRESWSTRLQRLLTDLEARMQPDVVLVDSRSGIDEAASACVTDLGANLVLLFALEGEQTWTGYRTLLEHWRQRSVARDMRERLQLVGAMLPELETVAYTEQLRDHAYELFAGSLYDDVPPGSSVSDYWHFEAADETAPHFPWGIKWHRSFAGMQSLQGRLAAIDRSEVNNIFGPLIDGVATSFGWELDGV